MSKLTAINEEGVTPEYLLTRYLGDVKNIKSILIVADTEDVGLRVGHSNLNLKELSWYLQLMQTEVNSAGLQVFGNVIFDNEED